MRHLAYLSIVLSISISSYAQNILTNGDFEKYVFCPTALNQIYTLNGWAVLNSPDYFNACSIYADTDVPTNYFGTQAAASGNGYAGLYTYTSNGNIREYINTSVPAMAPGATYEISMSVSLADSSGIATDGLGVMFYDPSPVAGVAIPQASFSKYGVITNKTGWVRLTDTFVADAAYKKLEIGCHIPAASQSRQLVPPGKPSSYYYVDSVVFRMLSTFYFYYGDSALCVGDTIKVNYGVLPNVFNLGNKFKLQLSDSNGNFNNPVTLDSITSVTSGMFTGVIPVSTLQGLGYRLRVISTSPSMVASTYDREIGIGTVIPQKPVGWGENLVCSNDTLHLGASTSTPNVSWYWVGPNSWWSQQRLPIVPNPTPVGPGFYYITAYVYGCEARDTVPVNAVSSPVIPIASATSSICEDDTIKLSMLQPPSGTTYNWTGPSGFTSNQLSPELPNATLAKGGAYIAYTHLNGCTESDTVNINVKPLPQLAANNNGPLCTGTQLNLTVTGTQNTSYSWTGPGSFSSNLAFPSRTNVVNSWSGKYVVTGVLNGCSKSDTTDVVIYPIPSTPTASSNNPVCVGGDIMLTCSAVTGAGSYEWGGPGIWGKMGQSVVRTNVALNDEGKYYVRAKVNNCYSLADTTYVNVNIGPEVLIYANPSDKICPNWKAGFVAVSKNAGASPTFDWYKNGSSTGGTGHNYVSPATVSGDSFYVRMTAGTSCNTPITSNSIKITVLPADPPPTIQINAKPGAHVWPYVPVTFKATPGNAGNNPGYQWMRNGIEIPLANNDEYTAYDLKTGDTICCKITSNFLCANPREVLSNCIVMNIDVGIDNTSIEQTPLHIFPNPNNGSFNIQMNTERGETIDIRVFDQLGKLVYKETNRARQKVYTRQIKLYTNATGIYYINITAGTENYSGRVIIDR